MKIINGIKINAKSRTFSLNHFSFAVLLLADIALAVIVFTGLNAQIDQLTSEYEFFPYTYRAALIEEKWVEENILDKIQSEVLRESVFHGEPTHKRMHPACEELRAGIEGLKGNAAVNALFRSRRRMQRNYDEYDQYQKSDLGMARAVHDSILLVSSELKAHKDVQGVISFVFSSQPKDFRAEIKAYRRLFALKRTGFGFLFLLPVILLLGFWNKKANDKERYLAVIISSHFILVASLPIAFELIRLVIEIIPNVLLKSIYDFLIKTKLVSVWYYAVILLVGVFITFLIWFLHTKVFTQKRFFRNRIQSGKCTQCGVRTDYRFRFCPNCGNELLRECPHCGKLTIRDYEFCQQCGKGS